MILHQMLEYQHSVAVLDKENQTDYRKGSDIMCISDSVKSSNTDESSDQAQQRGAQEPPPQLPIGMAQKVIINEN